MPRGREEEKEKAVKREMIAAANNI